MTYDPFHRATPEPKPREEIFAWVEFPGFSGESF